MVTKARMRRIRTGLTAREFSQRHALNSTTLSRIENGRTSAPPAYRPKMASALGVREDQLFDRNGWPRTVRAIPT